MWKKLRGLNLRQSSGFCMKVLRTSTEENLGISGQGVALEPHENEPGMLIRPSQFSAKSFLFSLQTCELLVL